MDDLESLRVRLKSGEYDGTDVMQAWLAVDALIAAKSALKEIASLPSVRQDECCNIALAFLDND